MLGRPRRLCGSRRRSVRRRRSAPALLRPPASPTIRADWPRSCTVRNRAAGCTPAHWRTIRRWSRRWPAIRPLWGNSAEVLVPRARPAAACSTRCAAAGLPCPDVIDCTRRRAATARGCASRCESAGGTGISVMRSEQLDRTDLASRQLFTSSSSSTGRPARPCTSPPAARRALLGVTRQLIGAAWTGAGGFRYCGSIGPLRVVRDRRCETSHEIGAVLASRVRPGRLVRRRRDRQRRGRVAGRSQSALHGLDRTIGSGQRISRPWRSARGGLRSRRHCPEVAVAAAARVCGKAIVFADAPTVGLGDDVTRQAMGGSHRLAGAGRHPAGRHADRSGLADSSPFWPRPRTSSKCFKQLRRQVAEIRAALSALDTLRYDRATRRDCQSTSERRRVRVGMVSPCVLVLVVLTRLPMPPGQLRLEIFDAGQLGDFHQESLGQLLQDRSIAFAADSIPRDRSACRSSPAHWPA